MTNGQPQNIMNFTIYKQLTSMWLQFIKCVSPSKQPSTQVADFNHFHYETNNKQQTTWLHCLAHGFKLFASERYPTIPR